MAEKKKVRTQIFTWTKSQRKDDVEVNYLTWGEISPYPTYSE